MKNFSYILKPIVWKSKILAESFYNLSSTEMKILSLAISKLNNDANADTTSIFPTDYALFSGVTRKHAKTMLEQFAESFPQRTITIRPELYILKWCEEVILFKETGQIKIKWAEEVKKHIFSLSPERWYIDHLHSFASLRFYELFRVNLREGKKVLSIGDIRGYMCLEETQYPLYGTLKKDVIIPSINEINEKTDIFIRIVETKVARKVVSVTFLIEKKQKLKKVV